MSEAVDLDDSINGVLIHSDNFQALNLLQARYREQVKCIYIDPPYNTSASEIIYKNGYKHSSWLSLVDNRLFLSKGLLADDGILCGTIDDLEQKVFCQLLEQNFPYLAGVVAIRIKPSGRPIPNGFALSHEYAVFVKKMEATSISRLSHSEEQKARYRENDEKGAFFWEMFRKAGSNSSRENRPTMFYPFFLNEKTGVLRLPEMEFDAEKNEYLIYDKEGDEEISIYPIKDDGKEGCWYFGLDRALEIVDEFRATKKDDGKYYIYYRRRPNEGVQPTTHWSDSKYSATEHGTALLKNIFGTQEVFSYPKSIYAVEDCLLVSGAKETTSLILDYFAGSGTTAHAVINLNREDDGNRKYMLVEQGEYFDTVLKPRVQKVIYSKEWKNGKPVLGEQKSDLSNDSGENPRHGVSQMVKVLKLESYEDTLNNLELKGQMDLALDLPEQVQEDYLLRYMLAEESKSSQLSVHDFQKPFDYELNIASDSAGAYVPTKIDLIETFNYLLGLRVQRVTDDREKRGYVLVEGRLNDESCLIVWRDCIRVGYQEIVHVFDQFNIHPNSEQYDVVYLNGDHDMASVWENNDGTESRLKLRAIEPEFLRLMFAE